MIWKIFLIVVFVKIWRIISFVACWGSALLTVEAKRPCWERNAPLIRLDARGTGSEGSGGDVLCDAERGDNEACLSLPHIPPPQQFHVVSAICCPDCASSTVPMTNWLAAHPLSSGLSLWISMCSSSTSVFVFFTSFPYSPSLQIPSISPQSSEDAKGGILWSAGNFHKVSEERRLQLWPMMSK